MWNRKIALSLYDTALFYSVNVLHLNTGSLERSQSGSGFLVTSLTISLYPRLLSLVKLSALGTSISE